MKLLLCAVLFLLLRLSAFAQAEAALIKSVKAKLDRVSDYQATGTMKIDVAFIAAPQSPVIVYYKKPDKFKVKKEGGVSILPKGGVSINLNSLLLTDNYTIVPAGTALIKGVNTKVVKLLPQDDKSAVVITTLYIDEKELLIRKSIVTTRENGSYEMDLDYGKFAAWGLPDKVVFSFNTNEYKLPKGITFEYEKGGPKKPPAVKDKKGRIEMTYSRYVINKGISDAVFTEK